MVDSAPPLASNRPFPLSPRERVNQKGQAFPFPPALLVLSDQFREYVAFSRRSGVRRYWSAWPENAERWKGFLGETREMPPENSRSAD